jgi:hypothetical protein
VARADAGARFVNAGLSALDTPLRRRAIRDGLSVVGILVLIGLFVIGRDPGYDAYGYWRAVQGDPYGQVIGLGAFHYSPVALVAFAPLGLLPGPVAYWVVAASSFAALVWLTGRWALAWLAFFPVASELYHGNIDLILAAAIVAGLTRPWPWSAVLHTKITPAVGLVWFAARREWRPLVVALAFAVVIALPLVILDPGLWEQWLAHLGETTVPAYFLVVPVPLWIRFVAAVVLIAWGALTDRRWTVLIGAMIAQPILGIIGFSMMAGLQRTMKADP